jgi:hypothetical protein
MPNGLLNLALGLAMQVGSPGPSESPNFPAHANAYGRYGFEGSSEQRHPYDTQQQWVHGYFQEIPAYGGHHVFRPYNYKDVLSQSQTAAGWGERANMPYSQQFAHKYHDQATMLKTTQVAPIWSQQLSSRYPTTQPMFSQPGWVAASNGSQIVVPSSGMTGHSIVLPSSSYQFAPTGAGEQPQGPALQQAVEIINPISYQQPASSNRQQGPRGANRLR